MDNTNKHTIYVLSMIHLKYVDGKIYRMDSYGAGFSFDLKDLEETVLTNDADIFECYFDYAVIEEVPIECLSCYIPAKTIQWYKAVYDKNHPNKPRKIVKCDVPEWAKTTFNWWA